ncbi:ATP-binding cassette domain-containing protein [Actinomadura sp. CNU-125]|uniref:ATP-binding cassette domain-containing protein n=1 Tax=Actinomadura sp. CNU-125 TaxID=1904961 RepID=UPI0021CCAFB6|nr:ATP-binding cassette domain-containing protein [Actinomadura sp. CNU-125]
MTGAVIEVCDLVVRYGTATALDRVALTVGAGEPVALIGPNGAGKTSLVNAVLGVLRPAAGRARVRGRAALVPEGRQMFDDLTVEDNLALGAWRRAERAPPTPPACTRCCRGWPSCAAAAPGRCPAGSSRWWRSGAR